MKTSKKNNNAATTNQPSAFQFFAKISTEQAALEYITNARWTDGIICVHCGADEVYKMRAGKLLKCKECRKQFTVRIGTVMEDSKIQLQKWLYAMYIFGIHSKGVSSVNMAKQIGVTQKSAWHMLHRLREAFTDTNNVLPGCIEVDETFIGGKEKNKHANKKLHAGRGAAGKQAVIGIRKCGGDCVAFPIANTDKGTLTAAVRKHGQRYINEVTRRQSFMKLPAFDDSNGSGISMVRMFLAGMEKKQLTYKTLINQ